MEMVEVCCCVLPDGTTFWTNEKAGQAKAVEAWKSTLSDERRIAFQDAKATLGAVIVNMPRECYQAIETKNDPITTAYCNVQRTTQAA